MIKNILKKPIDHRIYQWILTNKCVFSVPFKCKIYVIFCILFACFSNLNLKFFQIYGTFWHFISLKWLYSVPVFIVPAKSPSWNQEEDIFFQPKNAWGLKSKEWDRWSKRRVQSERAWQRDGMGRVCPPCGCCSAVQGVDSSRPNKKRGGETAKRER